MRLPQYGKQAFLFFGIGTHCLIPLLLPAFGNRFHLSLELVGMISTVHESASSLIAFYLIKALTKKSSVKWTKPLGWALAWVAIADFMYGVFSYLIRIQPPRGLWPLWHELPYALFSLFLSWAVTVRALEGLKKRDRFLAVCTVLALASLYFVPSYKIILDPFFHAIPSRPAAIFGTASVYAISQSIFMGGLVVASFRTVGFVEFLFWLFFLTLTGSDFVLRYQDIGGNLNGITIFEYGWEFALAAISSLLIYEWVKETKDNPSFLTLKPAPFLSFRVLTASIALISLVTFFAGTWTVSSYLGVATPVTVGTYIIFVFLIWGACNTMSIVLSKSLRTVQTRLVMKQRQNSDAIAVLWETRALVGFLSDRNYALQEERNKVLRITSTVAHDIRPSLAAVNCSISLLESEKPATNDRETVDEIIYLLKLASSRIRSTTDQMLEERKQIRNQEPIHLSISNALKIARLNYPNKNFCVTGSEHSSAVSAVGLTSNLLNLISNAAEASDDKSVILIKANYGHEAIEITIQDQGCGISPGLLTSLRKGEQRTTKSNGNGIGLSSAFEWANENCYEFKMFSNEGKGTTVSLRIPI